MRVFLVFVALTALILRSEALNRTQWVFNRTQALNSTRWNVAAPNWIQNRTQWKLQTFNNTRWNFSAPNRTQWNRPALQRTIREAVPNVPVKNNTWNQTTHNGDVIVGQIGYLDRLLFNQTYRKERRWWSGREKIIEYPKDLPGKYINRQETITAIRIYNKFYDGLDSEAQILSGGAGFRFVKIKLSSSWNKGFEYLVQLFGR